MTWTCPLLLAFGLVLTSTIAQNMTDSPGTIGTGQQDSTDPDGGNKSHGTTPDQSSGIGVSNSEERETNASGPHGTTPTIQESSMARSSMTWRPTNSPGRTQATALPSGRSSSTVTRKRPPPISRVSPKPTADTSSGTHTGTIIIVAIVIAVLVLGGVCYLTKKKSHSVDFSPRQEEVQIPLNAGDLEEVASMASQNGSPSFVQNDTDVKVASEAEPGNTTQEREGAKAEADKPVGEGSSGPSAPTPTPDSSVTQLAEGSPAENAAPVAPVEQTSMQQKANEPTESNKSSEESPVEPPKETDASNNNNNNFGISATGQSRDIPEPPLDSPV